MERQGVKQRFGIIGDAPALNLAIDVAMQIAPTDITVLIIGESGTGKEVFSQIIHQLSPRKHNPFIAVNCGAIPDGTVDSELFGHEKGAFTGAHEARKGYFENVDSGTIFLDEVSELPPASQARLLRVLESGEYIRVGSSKVQKTDVRAIAASNINLIGAVNKGKFREDLYYRLNTVPIFIPPLRERGEDIQLLFRKFASDTSEKYRIESLKLDEKAKSLLMTYHWPGNVRQLKNIAEQMAILEEEREITVQILEKYLPREEGTNLPVLFNEIFKESDVSERDNMFKFLFDMKKDIMEMKKIIINLIQNGGNVQIDDENSQLIQKLHQEIKPIGDDQSIPIDISSADRTNTPTVDTSSSYSYEEPHEEVEESLSLEDKEIEMINRALQKYKGKRKNAAKELGISERTLYRKIKEYNITK